MQERFLIKINSSCVKAEQAWEATKATEGAANDAAAAFPEASPPDQSETELERRATVDKDAKKKRKKRRARRDTEIKAKAADPQELRTPSSQTPQTSVASSLSTTFPQPTTIASNNTRLSRSLMSPALPHKLQFANPKKNFVTMQNDISEMQLPLADEKSRTADS